MDLTDTCDGPGVYLAGLRRRWREARNERHLHSSDHAADGVAGPCTIGPARHLHEPAAEHSEEQTSKDAVSRSLGVAGPVGRQPGCRTGSAPAARWGGTRLGAL